MPFMGVNSSPLPPSDVVYSLFCSKEGKGGARSESGAVIPPRSCGVEGLGLNSLESGNVRWFGKEA
jgi:hypothetical protein